MTFIIFKLLHVNNIEQMIKKGYIPKNRNRTQGQRETFFIEVIEKSIFLCLPLHSHTFSIGLYSSVSFEVIDNQYDFPYSSVVKSFNHTGYNGLYVRYLPEKLS